MARYPQGGGHWSVSLQYLFGLRCLGRDFFWLELLRSIGSRRRDLRLISALSRALRTIWSRRPLRSSPVHSKNERPDFLCTISRSSISTRSWLQRLIAEASILWNFHCSMRQPLLGLFPRRALIDLDPGHLQVSALHVDMDIQEHDVFFSVGTNINGADCELPSLGRIWHPFLPPVFLSAGCRNVRLLPMRHSPLLLSGPGGPSFGLAIDG